MAKYAIIYDREGCIGCGSCAGVCPENWSMSDDNKADVANKDVPDEAFVKNKEAADSCPVNVIHVINNETGERLI